MKKNKGRDGERPGDSRLKKLSFLPSFFLLFSFPAISLSSLSNEKIREKTGRDGSKTPHGTILLVLKNFSQKR
jgi:hypothetical protein